MRGSANVSPVDPPHTRHECCLAVPPVCTTRLRSCAWHCIRSATHKRCGFGSGVGGLPYCRGTTGADRTAPPAGVVLFAAAVTAFAFRSVLVFPVNSVQKRLIYTSNGPRRGTVRERRALEHT